METQEAPVPPALFFIDPESLSTSRVRYCDNPFIAAVPTLLLLFTTAVCGGLIEVLYNHNLFIVLYCVLGAAVGQNIVLTIMIVIMSRKCGGIRSYTLLLPMGLAVIAAMVVIGSAINQPKLSKGQDFGMGAWLILGVIAAPVGVISLVMLCCLVRNMWIESS